MLYCAQNGNCAQQTSNNGIYKVNVNDNDEEKSVEKLRTRKKMANKGTEYARGKKGRESK